MPRYGLAKVLSTTCVRNSTNTTVVPSRKGDSLRTASSIPEKEVRPKRSFGPKCLKYCQPVFWNMSYIDPCFQWFWRPSMFIHAISISLMAHTNIFSCIRKQHISPWIQLEINKNDDFLRYIIFLFVFFKVLYFWTEPPVRTNLLLGESRIRGLLNTQSLCLLSDFCLGLPQQHGD